MCAMSDLPVSNPSLSRRAFLAHAGGALVLSAVPAPITAESQIATPSPSSSTLDTLRAIFAAPPDTAKPMTRWWWFGGAVTPEEITRELTFMKDAGLRGAEIQPVYPVAVDDPARGIRHLRYFTAEWVDVLGHTIREARRLGLQLDFTLGSGWPYGGPFMPTGLSARRVRALTRDARGPREIAWDVTPHLTGDDRIVAVVAVPLRDGEPDSTRSQVLQGQPRPDAARGQGRWIRTPIGDGSWRILLVLDSPTGQLVKRPTLGMEGPVMDHHGKEAMTLFLRAAGTRVVRSLRDAGQPPFHSVFCDSFEVYGADWTQNLLEEFAARRGYDLAPWLPALWDETGSSTPHVRYDYHLTLSDLMLDYFVGPLARWAEEQGMRARIQAHGAMGDVISAYGLAHIPEGETIFLGDRYQVNLHHRRLASSAGHLYAKPLVSAETYTWLRTPMYMTTLEMLKAATDAVFLDGINHIVNHGYSYSPPQAGEPGWAFYASTEVNHTNTWWRHYPYLAKYVQRTCAILQQGEAVNPIAVYLPLADIYAQHGAGGVHIDTEAETRLGSDLFNGLRRAGYDFDLIHDHALKDLATIDKGVLKAGTARYAVIVVPAVRWMPEVSATRLADFVRAGGHLIVMGHLPEGAPGMKAQQEGGDAPRRVLSGLLGEPRGTSAPSGLPGNPRGTLAPSGLPSEPRGTIAPSHHAAVGTVAAAGSGSAALVADPAAMMTRLRAVLQPDFEIVECQPPAAKPAAVENVGFLHRRRDALDVYFVANVSADTHALRIRFAAGHRAPERWDSETSVVQPLLSYEYSSIAGRPVTLVDVPLDPFESCFIVFGHSTDTPAVTRTSGPALVQLSRRGSRVGSRVEATALARENGELALSLGTRSVRRIAVTGVPSPRTLDGPWTLRLGDTSPTEIESLVSWTSLPFAKGFSGWAVYQTEFDWTPSSADLQWAIDLGRVHETAEVILNGRTLGAAWKGRRLVPCGAALQPGRNHLTVEVANLWIHHVLAQPAADVRALEETVGVRWGRYGEVPPEVIPLAGLLGPVRLLANKRISIRLG
jgi:alpha-L-rhamnosidase